MQPLISAICLQTLVYGDCERRTADAHVRPLFSRLMCKDIKVQYRTSDANYAKRQYRRPLFFSTIYASLIHSSPPLPPGPRSHQGRVCLSDTLVLHFFDFLIHIHSSCGVVFSVGLLRENISLLTRTFMSINWRRTQVVPSQPTPGFPRCRDTLWPRWDFATWSGRWYASAYLTSSPPSSPSLKLRFRSHWPFILL